MRRHSVSSTLRAGPRGGRGGSRSRFRNPLRAPGRGGRRRDARAAALGRPHNRALPAPAEQLRLSVARPDLLYLYGYVSALVLIGEYFFISYYPDGDRAEAVGVRAVQRKV